MNSSLACTDILIPPPNPPQHIYLRELIKSLSSHFPSRCSSSSPSRFNKQGHRNNCRGQRRAKGGHMFAKHKHHLNVCPHKWASGHNYEARYRHLVDSSDGCDGLSASLPLSLLFLRPFLAAPADRLRGDIVRRSWVTWGLIAKSPFSSYIKKLFIPGAQKALLIHAVLSGQSWHMWDEQLCGLASLTLFCCLLECRLKKKTVFIPFYLSNWASRVCWRIFASSDLVWSPVSLTHLNPGQNNFFLILSV